jgi:hypothetical protein
MKRFLFILAFAIMCQQSLTAQEGLRVGGHLGIPVGDASDFTSLTLGGDITYLWQVTEMLAVGASSGFGIYLGKDDYSNYSFIPLAVSGRVSYPENWFYVADIGYALALEDGADGGFYIQPKIGYTTGSLDIFIYYQNISENGASIASFGAGIAFPL